MKHEEIEPRVQSALRALADADREVGAPPQVEVRLQTAFRNRNRKRKMSLWIPLAAAAVILLGFAIEMKRPRVVSVEPVIATNQAPAPRIATVEPVIAKVTPARHVASATPANKPQEIVTDFFPLPSYAPADDADGAELLRVTLPAAAMREVGLPVREERLADRVQADVLVTHGVARAVRFVRSE